MWIPTTCPITTLARLSSAGRGSSTTCSSLHSIAIGEAFTRGGLTLTDAAASSPACAISSTLAGECAAVMIICSRSAKVHMLNTNSPVASTLLSESLCSRVPGLNEFGQYITHGGSALSELKKLNGARLITPSLPRVEIQPIGRGSTSALYTVCWNGAGFMPTSSGLKNMRVTPVPRTSWTHRNRCARDECGDASSRGAPHHE
jgi:hypothetical protein